MLGFMQLTPESAFLTTTMTSRTQVLSFVVCALFAILQFLVFVYFHKDGTQDFRYGKCVLTGKTSPTFKFVW